MTVEVVSVEQRVWSGTATLVSAQTTEGEVGIMPAHAPMLGQLVEGGVVSITTTDGERRVAAIHGGFLSVTGQKVSVLAESAEWSQDIDVDAARRTRDDAASGETDRLRAKGRVKAVERA